MPRRRVTSQGAPPPTLPPFLRELAARNRWTDEECLTLAQIMAHAQPPQPAPPGAEYPLPDVLPEVETRAAAEVEISELDVAAQYLLES